MKIQKVLIVLGVLYAQAICSHVFAVTNEVNYITQSDLDAAHSPYPPNKIQQVATNTPTFERYGLKLMLTEAEKMREQCQLDIPEPLSVSNVFFSLKATAFGIDGGLATRNGRFRWRFANNVMQAMADTNYASFSFRHRDDEEARLAKIKSKINSAEAVKIAQFFLHRQGLTEAKLNLKAPPKVNQYKYEESDGTVYPLPAFNIEWHDKNEEPDDFGVLTITVSGITKQVSEYLIFSRFAPHSAFPTNYFDMLGVKPPTNFDQRIGFKPLERLSHPPPIQWRNNLSACAITG